MANGDSFIGSFLRSLFRGRRNAARQSNACALHFPCLPPDFDPLTIVAVGDLQRTGFAERTYLRREQNDEARSLITEAIAEENPDMLLLLGDQVADGANDLEWEYFDRLMAKIHRAGIPVYALLGNHDYSVLDKPRSLMNFYERFPDQGRELPEVLRLGSIALVPLDSNARRIGPDEMARQVRAYRRILDDLDGDPTVRGVIVASHHPPYTNSRLPVDPLIVTDFAGPFLEARKTLFYLSGHVHSYERFTAEQKTFIVSGGGGGPRRPIDISERRPLSNDAYSIGRVRPFHYLRFTVAAEELRGEAIMLQESPEGKGEFVIGDRFAARLMEPERESLIRRLDE